MISPRRSRIPGLCLDDRRGPLFSLRQQNARLISSGSSSLRLPGAKTTPRFLACRPSRLPRDAIDAELAYAKDDLVAKHRFSNVPVPCQETHESEPKPNQEPDTRDAHHSAIRSYHLQLPFSARLPRRPPGASHERNERQYEGGTRSGNEIIVQ